MSDATVTALVVGIPAFFTGLASLIVAWRGSRKVEVVAGAVEAVNLKTDTVIEKAVEIHTLTNSNLSRVTSQLEVANTKLEGFAESQRVSGAEIKALQSLVNTLVERERGVEKAVKETNGILSAKSDSGPLPVVDEKVVNKLDEIVTPKLNEIRDTVKKTQDEQHQK